MTKEWKFYHIFLAGLLSLAVISCAQPKSQAASSQAQVWPKEHLGAILLAEIAEERGRYVDASEIFLALAKRTQNVYWTQRAFTAAALGQSYDHVDAALNQWEQQDAVSVQMLFARILLGAQKQDSAQIKVYWPRYVAQIGFDAALAQLDKALRRGQAWENVTLVFETLLPTIDEQKLQPWCLTAAGLGVFYSEFVEANQWFDRSGASKQSLQPQAARVYADIALGLAEIQFSIPQLQVYVATYPEDWFVQERLARLELLAGETYDAKSRLVRIVQNQPEAWQSRYYLSVLLLKNNEIDDAKTQLNTLLKAGQFESMSQYYLGLIAEEEGQLALAKNYYEQVRGADYLQDAQLRLVGVLSKMGQSQEALDQLKRLTKKGVDPEHLALLEAEIHLKAKHWRQAFMVLSQGVKDHPQSTDLLYAYAMAAYELGEDEIYERSLLDLLVMDADHVDALNALGYFYAEKNIKLQEAWELVSRANDLRPQAFHILDSLGWVAYRLERWQEAEGYLRQSLGLRVDEEVLYHLLVVLSSRGDQQAIEALTKDYGLIIQKSKRIQQLLKL